ncbi:MAG: PEGA domain-containing protein [Fibrobacter sp.]|nr:PEGA domain-containing protein [Fibrobacter sp.]
MRKLLAALFILLLPCTALAKYVAVLETAADGKAREEIDIESRQYLTNVIREQAVRVLPAEQNWTIMTRENINVMLPPGKTIEDCEGSCLAETGKNIAADYVAQARIGKFGENYTISCEMYETAGNKLVASFNADGIANVEGIVAELKTKAPEFFKKIRGIGGAWGGGSGFGDFSTAGDFAVVGNQMFIVNVSTNPGGAMLSIDGRPVPKCSSTPCKIQVEAGEHRFVTVLEHYEDFDSLVTVNANEQQIAFNMVPNFGTLFVNPERPDNVGNPEDLRVSVDGKLVAAASTEMLDPGVHAVSVTHPCYDPVEFKVAIEKGKNERYEQPMVRAKGGLSLSAEFRGEPQSVPVFVNGNEVGKTPYLGEVPLCSRVAVGDVKNPEIVDVNLKFHETVAYTHELKKDPFAKETLTAIDQTRAQAEKGYNDLECATGGDCKKVGESIPANVESDESGIHWVPVIASAAVLVGGSVLAVVGNSNAKSASEKKIKSESDYKKNKDDAHNGQTLRTVGVVTAIVGAVGLGVSFAF